MPKCRVGADSETAQPLANVADALEYCKVMGDEPPGYIWVLNARRKHWAICANYDGKGSVWNGQAQCVPATTQDVEWLCRHSL